MQGVNTPQEPNLEQALTLTFVFPPKRTMMFDNGQFSKSVRQSDRQNLTNFLIEM